MLAPASIGERTGQVFYVWFSVFNLFATMPFWALMADRFSLEQSKRLFGVIAVGGTLGAIFGAWLASLLARLLGTPALLLVAVGFLLLATGAAGWLTRFRTDRLEPTWSDRDDAPASTQHVVIGGSAWEGFQAVFRSPYLLAICAYVLIVAVMATLVYFTRLQMVAVLPPDTRTHVHYVTGAPIETAQGGFDPVVGGSALLSEPEVVRHDRSEEELLLDRTTQRGRHQSVHGLDKKLIARGQPLDGLRGADLAVFRAWSGISIPTMSLPRIAASPRR